MSALHPDDATSQGSPYRAPPLPLPVPAPSGHRPLVVVSYVLATCALLATLTSLHVACTLTRLVTLAPAPRARPMAPPAVAVPAPALALTSAPKPILEPGHRPAPYGIRPVGHGVYVVPRRAIDDALSDQAALARSSRIVPVTREGHVVGVRVFGIHPGGLMDALGLENGDMLLRIDDVDVASPDRCLEAYSRLRTTDRVTLTLERDGVVREHVYAIVGVD